jgi:23S rRNA pseudouridine1911/1915/1917 synthase
MVFARSQAAASILSEQVRTREFEKEYLAAAHGRFKESAGQMEDLLWYNRSLRKSRVMQETGRDVKRALLSYEVLAYCEDQDVSLVRIRLHTGRTHQIRVQFASRSHALLGDRKYGAGEQDGCRIALWSYKLSFLHPQSGQPIAFSAAPPAVSPWNLFNLSELS